MVFCSQPLTQSSYDGFNIDDFKLVFNTVGSGVPSLAAPGLRHHITLDLIRNSNIKVSTCKQNRSVSS